MTISERTRQEQLAGRLNSFKVQAEALAKMVMAKYNLRRECKVLVNYSEDPKDWTVRYVSDKMNVDCNWQEFPSEEFIATLMMLGDIK